MTPLIKEVITLANDRMGILLSMNIVVFACLVSLQGRGQLAIVRIGSELPLRGFVVPLMRRDNIL